MIKKLLTLLFLLSLSFVEITQAQTGTKLYKFVPPSFGNGDEALNHYFSENLILKSKDFKTEIKGAVTIKFKLTKDGELIDFVMLDSSSSTQFNQDALKCLKLNKKMWHRAKIDGQFCDITIFVGVRLFAPDGQVYRYYVGADYNYVIDGTLINNYYNMGSDLASKGMYQEAVPYFDQIISLSSSDVDALYNRGVCHMKTGDMTKACADWQIIQNSGKPDADKLLLKYCAK